MIRILAAFCLATGSVAVAAAQPAQSPARQTADFFQRNDSTVRFLPAGVTLPARPASLRFHETGEFSHQGEGIDAAVQYRSPDQTVFATVYFYYPGLPHAGLAALATDNAIRSQSEVVRGLARGTVAAGDVPNAAIRHDYSGYRQNLASSAAFLKVGRWIVKLRVSGPEARREEVERAMTALLEGMRFEGTAPRPAAPAELGDCPAGAGRQAAELLPDESVENVMTHAILGTLDGAGEASPDQQGGETLLPARVPSLFCVSGTVGSGNSAVPVLRSVEGVPQGIDGATVAVVPLSDSGIMLEVVEIERLGRHFLLLHQIGSTSLLGSFDAPPSDRQFADMVEGRLPEAIRPRVRVQLRPGQNVEIQVIAPPAEAR